MKKLLNCVLISLLVLFTNCYRVKERNYLFITFNESRLNPNFLKYYVDSVRNRKLKVPDSINDIFFSGAKIDEQESLIQFTNNPQEWYLVMFNASPCWIGYIYNEKLSPNLITKKRFLGKEQIDRIKKRFENEILKPAEQFGKMHHFADTTIYN